jgi:CRISPR-associated protein Csm3
LTPLSIGFGGSILGVDNPVARIGGKPYIPGSSLKGVLRTNAERFARLLLPNELVCNILNANEELERKKNEQGKYRPCIICAVFGGPTIASHLSFSNATLKNESGTPLSVVRHVSIDRVTNAARGERLYDIEQVEPGAKFKLGIQIENIDFFKDKEDNRSKIVLQVLKDLTGGVFLGARKTIGNGLVQGSLMRVVRSVIEKNALVSSDITQDVVKLVRGLK